jgi:hypothetical protein
MMKQSAAKSNDLLDAASGKITCPEWVGFIGRVKARGNQTRKICHIYDAKVVVWFQENCISTVSLPLYIADQTIVIACYCRMKVVSNMS